MLISAPEQLSTPHSASATVQPRAFPQVIQSLHGLRGWMAVTVLTSHALGESGGEFMARLTSTAVFVFFVLSGFILSHVYHRKFFSSFSVKEYQRFLRNRAARILPLYFATTLAAFSLLVIAGYLGRQFSVQWDTSLQNLIVNLLALDVWQRFEPGVGYAFPFVRWSVTVEIWMYALVFPLLGFFYRGMGQNVRRIGYAIVATLIIYAIMMVLIPPTFPLEALLVRGIPFFICGFLVYSLGPRRLSFAAEVLVWSIVAVALFVSSKALLVVSTLTVFALANGSASNPLVRFCSTRFSAFLGDISYSIYLWHGVFGLGIDTVKGAIGTYFSSIIVQNLLCLAILLAVTLLTSVLSYRYFELPMQSFIRGRHSARSA